MEINETLGIEGLLKQAVEQKLKVEIHLESGKSLAGLVQSVGDHNVVLTSLVTKEFFSAIVRLEHISAVEVRVKTQ